jgi:TolB protein
MVLLHRGGAAGSFSIALQELASGDLTPLTFSKFDESPSLSPNGKMVVYASKQKGKGILRISTIDGRVNFKIPKSAGDMQEPAWSPYFE